MALSVNDKDIPTWNGLEDSWADYVREVEWLVFSIPAKHRNLIAAKLARKLTGSAKQAIKGLQARDFHGIKGLKHLMDILQSRIGVLPVPDLANKLDEFIFRLRRRAGETMNDWGLRSTEAYRVLTLALDRVRGKEVQLADFGLDLLDQPRKPHSGKPQNGKPPDDRPQGGWAQDDWNQDTWRQNGWRQYPDNAALEVPEDQGQNPKKSIQYTLQP